MAERTPAWCAQPADASSAACVSASRAVPTSATSRPTSLLKESVGPLPALKGKVAARLHKTKTNNDGQCRIASLAVRHYLP